MNKTLLKITGVLLLAIGLTSPSFATPINGNITFKGGVVLNSTTVNTATTVTSWVDARVQNVDGDFATYVTTNDAVDFNAPWSFNSGALNSFWTVNGFTFDLISSSIVYQDHGFLFVDGSGTVSGHNLDSYVGSWSFTTQDRSAGGVFSFSGSTSVPDSGTTALLLGSALVGMSVIARRRKAV